MIDDSQKEMLRACLQSYVEQITEKSKGKGMYVCPLCLSGTGKNKTGAFSLNGNRFKCHSCGEGGDIFDLVSKVNGLTNFKDILKKTKELLGDYSIQGNHVSYAHTKRLQKPQEEKKQVDYSDYFDQANKRINDTDYHRGISLETLNRFNVGYDPMWAPPGSKSSTTQRLIIPTSSYSYLARDTSGKADIPKQKIGGAPIFNHDAIKSDKPSFITEGEIDALSVIDVGANSMALGGTSGVPALISLLEREKPSKPLILLLDGDTEGRKAQEDLKNGLVKLGVSYIEADLSEPDCKDPNEFLLKDREEFKAYIKNLEQKALDFDQLRNKEYRENQSNHGFFMDFYDGIHHSVDTPCVSTGFTSLDKHLDGGLYEGLYIFGAISSLGKTTYVLQLADHIAQACNDVLIFSLEMSRFELMARSISRHTCLIASKSGLDNLFMKTSRGITSKDRYAGYSTQEQDLIGESFTAYNEYNQRIFTVEGMGDVSALDIRQRVMTHIAITGKKPVVIIDYLQLLSPCNDRLSDKQNIDKSVLELKRISRDFKLPVLGISSLNRDSYKDPISMKAFKESGGIEYSSDVLIGLQFFGVGAKEFEVDEAKRKHPRDIELVVLKNRSGQTGGKISYKYYSMYNYFEECF